MAQCDAAGFKFAGVEYGYECRCSNGPIQGAKIAESSCNVPCASSLGRAHRPSPAYTAARRDCD